MGLHERLQRIEAEHAGGSQTVRVPCRARSKPGSDLYRCTKESGHVLSDRQHEDDYGSKWLDSPFRILIWKAPQPR